MRRTVRSIRSFFRSSAVKGPSVPGVPKAEAEKSRADAFKDRFDVGNILGKGNFSVVRSAVDKETGEEVAVKIISKKHLTKDDKAAIHLEVEILSRISHPNIIQFYGMYDDATSFYVVTELVKGGELFDRIVEKEFYHEADAVKVIKTMAEALLYCHERGVAHRDLKPENVLLVSDDNDWHIKIADFGFAKDLVDGSSEESLMKTTCGTPGYVAPEIISGKPYSKQVDLWSLGVIAFILLAGYPPFYDDNQANLFRLIKKAKYKFDDEYWADISDDAKDLIRGLLVVDGHKRLTAQQVLDHPWIRNGGAEADITPALKQLRSYQNRRRLKRTVNAVIAVNKMRGLLSAVKTAAKEEAAKEEAAKNLEADGDEPEDQDQEDEAEDAEDEE